MMLESPTRLMFQSVANTESPAPSTRFTLQHEIYFLIPGGSRTKKTKLLKEGYDSNRIYVVTGASTQHVTVLN